ncbi:hypothetical protein BS47DRAFT_1354100 [Hydnum rufescens UP504]|uniref:Uncharacterized protein n=1 Tax=Hydnum rufescens UP504 TaxID=1448309 RepID=A0A9P6AH94_9AGAM|nr:hypothetical protein BS47DRAFT_1354100 [Hydnum rufescens UP504]
MRVPSLVTRAFGVSPAVGVVTLLRERVSSVMKKGTIATHARMRETVEVRKEEAGAEVGPAGVEEEAEGKGSSAQQTLRG